MLSRKSYFVVLEIFLKCSVHRFLFIAEVPLETLVKKYAGAYAEGFEWPQPACQSEDEDKDEVEGMVSSSL